MSNFLHKALTWAACFMKFDINLWKKFIMATNQATPFASLGAGNSQIALVMS
jgi:uncharacterized protein YhbP (UPF0306 family)